MSTKDLYYEDRRPVRLGQLIGRGGEGEVFAVADDGGSAVKLYTSTPREREQKIVAMVREGLATKSPLISFPSAVVRTRNGNFAGFVMKLVSAHRPLHDLYAPGSRKHKFPQADYRFLVRTASNVARAVARLHALGCVIGDINHSSILVSPTATVALIDADSFQVRAGGVQYFCAVGVPEYTPPELQGQPLHNTPRTPNHDCFGLAVVLFQLLMMGRHPFIGTVRQGELPPLPDAIRDRRFVYAERRNVGMDQPPGTPALSDLTSPIAALFEQAFAEDTSAIRPTAASWVPALEGLEAALVQCEANRLHHTPRDADDCLWCSMEAALKTVLFIPQTSASSATEPFAIGSQGFDLDLLWLRIEAIPVPSLKQLAPSLPALSLTPSAEAHALARPAPSNTGARIVTALAALAVVALAPQLIWLWAPLGLYAIFGGGAQNTKDYSGLEARYLAASLKWEAAVEEWRQNCGIDALLEERANLNKARTAYTQLPQKEKGLVGAYTAQRRDRQLAAYLDNFELRDATIKGIGPSKLATLASYGIETAADVERHRVLEVPGFGPKNSADLFAWRDGLEKRFRYVASPNASDVQETNRIRAMIAAEASMLRRALEAGPTRLEQLAGHTRRALANPSPALSQAHAELQQARCDLEFLGRPLPRAPHSYGKVAGSTPATSTTPYTATASSGSAPNCPRCGSGMIRRRAKRGKYAGRMFWGCSRYPQCRGTRNS